MSNLTGRAPFQKGAKLVSKPLRDASRGATCTLRIPGICNGNSETVVGCHVNVPGFHGMAMKAPDLFLIDGCSACHSVLDEKSKWAECGLDGMDICRALMESQMRRLTAGLITVKGER